MRTSFAFAILLLTMSASAQPPSARWQLLDHGTYHGNEAPSAPGTGWLALTAVGGVWRLEPTVVRATQVHDVVLDEEDQKTGLEISSNYSDSLALLRLPGLKAGKVDTPNMKFKGTPRTISTGDRPLRLSFKGDDYVITAVDSEIYLQSGEQKTLLPNLSAGGSESDDSTSLLWAGDLDGDGKLDLLFAYSGYNNGGICLYMSVGAGNAALVKQVACHGGVGC